jgi:hypothetical protein
MALFTCSPCAGKSLPSTEVFSEPIINSPPSVKPIAEVYHAFYRAPWTIRSQGKAATKRIRYHYPGGESHHKIHNFFDMTFLKRRPATPAAVTEYVNTSLSAPDKSDVNEKAIHSLFLPKLNSSSIYT